MKPALALLLMTSACLLRTPRVETTPCSNSLQCDHDAVCFLGECRPHSKALTVVTAEIQPVNDSSLGVLQVGGIDLSQSVVHDFQLVPPLSQAGSVTQAQNGGAAPVPVPGAIVSFTDRQPVISDRVEQVVVQTDNGGGFSARLPQGVWDVLVQPPAPLPPYRPSLPLSTTAPALTFVLPAVGTLTPFQAALTGSGTPLAGADVSAVDASGNPLSAPATVQADGGYSLYLPPATPAKYLQVGPPTESNGGALAPSLNPLPNYDRWPAASVVDVPLPPLATLSGVVTDSAGAPVAGARVYARSDGMAWSLARSTSTASDGSYALILRAGDYVVEAAPIPGQNAPGVSGEKTISVAASGATLPLVCPPRLHGYGLIVRPDGSAVGGNFQVTATRLADRLITTRTAYTTPTDSGGIWHISADPGRYRVEVVPPADTGLPRKIIQMELPAPSNAFEVPLQQIVLSPPLLVGGKVHGAPPGGIDQPVPNATVSFYALDADGHGILLGSAATDSKGLYKAILPDVATPGAASLEPGQAPR